MKQEQAIVVGQQALIWIAGEPEILSIFLDASGMAPEDVRARASNPEFLGFVLDFVLAADEHVVAFAAASSLAVEAPARARAVLGGGEPHWT
jgi:hypothetical protein